MKKKLVIRIVSLLVCLFVVTQALTGCAATLLSLVFYAGIPNLQNQFEPDPVLDFVYEQKDYDQLLEKQSKLEEMLKDPDSKSSGEIEIFFNDYLMDYMYMLEQYQISNVLSYCYGDDEQIDADYLEMSERYNAQFAQINSYYLSIYNSKHRDHFFSDWDEDSIRRMTSRGMATDPAIEKLNSENDELILNQSKLDQESPTFVDDSYALYGQYVHNARELAALFGYPNYFEYMADLTFSRDYSLEQMREFTDSVAKNIISTLTEVIKAYQRAYGSLSESELKQLDRLSYEPFTLDINESRIRSFLTWENSEIIAFYDKLSQWDCIFKGLKENGAQEGAFTMYMYVSGVPVMYFGPGYDDPFTFIHEFGHAFNMASTYDSEVATSLDLDEVTSQAHEVLFLAYLADEFGLYPYRMLRLEKILDFLQTILLSCFVADFEYEVFTPEKEVDTSEYSKIIDDLLDKRYTGLTDLISRDGIEQYVCLVTLSQSCYYISYATSLMPSLSLDKIAHEEGLDKAEEIYFKLATTGDKNFLTLLDFVGLDDPMDPKTFESLCTYYKKWAQSGTK